MFWAYCVQNKTKIEAEHSGATYQMSRLEDVGLVRLQFSRLSPGPVLLGAPRQSSIEQQPGAHTHCWGKSGPWFCRRQKYQLWHGTGELLSPSNVPLTAASWIRRQEFCLGEDFFPRTVPARADARCSLPRAGKVTLSYTPLPALSCRTFQADIQYFIP